MFAISSGTLIFRSLFIIGNIVDSDGSIVESWKKNMYVRVFSLQSILEDNTHHSKVDWNDWDENPNSSLHFPCEQYSPENSDFS